jgi:sugar transferase (PEP-CTERM/EpsH1 system associated)
MPGSPRLFSLCKHLAKNNRVTLLAFNDEGDDAERAKRAAVADIFERIILLPRAPEPRWWSQQVHRLRRAPSFLTRYRNRPYYDFVRERLREVLTEGAFDLLFVDGLESSQYVMGNSIPCPAAIDLHDCLTLFATRSLQSERNRVVRLRLASASRSVARWEKSLSRTFERIIVNSEVDETFLKELDPSANTLTISNGVDIEYFHPTSAASDPSRLVFTGVMSYSPNEDAAIFFGDSILPLVQAEIPEVKFDVVGKGPSERVKALGTRMGVRVLGEVPDIRPYLAASGIFVCPLRWGTGVKNKILAALAMGLPVVATPLSLDGLDLRPEVDLLVASDPAEFASKVARLIRNPQEREQLARAGRETVRRLYSWEGSGSVLEKTFEQLVPRHSRSPIPQLDILPPLSAAETKA